MYYLIIYDKQQAQSNTDNCWVRQGTANLGNSSDMQFTPLCSPALSPRDIPATGREKDRTVADFTEVSMSLEETKSQQPAVSPGSQRSQRPMKGDYST